MLAAMPPEKRPAKGAIQAPRGTRDLYPEETARIRYIQKAWTDAALRHGFEEIEGPTFETSDLYAVKSGEGILGELFQAFSGKSPEEIEQVRETGRAPFALRPEFTPTLARMYAARAKQLNKPCKWFTAGPYFRAERPQRGRLREFLQWNCDVIGDDGTPEGRAQADAECVLCCKALLEIVGIGSSIVSLAVSHRGAINDWLQEQGVPEGRLADVLHLLDAVQKLPLEAVKVRLSQLGLNPDLATIFKIGLPASVEVHHSEGKKTHVFSGLQPLWSRLEREVGEKFVYFDLSIVRGLAYYTGTVFEAIADGERAVAGGGRYDNLIELMGGPPTPAVGFAMGDVVLGLLLEDKGLMPEGAELLDAISAPGASRRPEVFAISADDEATDPMTRRLVADLRRGVESARARDEALKPWDRRRYEAASGGVRPLHARHTYKSTRNLKKLLGDAERQLARFAAVVHGEDRVQLRDLDRRAELTPKDVPGLPDDVAEFSVDPESAVYVGRAVAALLADA
jgi:histidyl-tRNA synthetase